jgi:hypothetical protein
MCSFALTGAMMELRWPRSLPASCRGTMARSTICCAPSGGLGQTSPCWNSPAPEIKSPPSPASSVPPVGRSLLMTALAEQFAVGCTISATHRLRLDVMEVGVAAVARHCLVASSVVSVALPPALAPTSHDGVHRVLHALGKISHCLPVSHPRTARASGLESPRARFEHPRALGRTFRRRSRWDDDRALLLPGGRLLSRCGRSGCQPGPPTTAASPRSSQGRGAGSARG